jgi:hypothetical protein
MDPLSDVLALLNPSGYAAAAFDFGGEWCVDFQRQAGIKCYALVSEVESFSPRAQSWHRTG